MRLAGVLARAQSAFGRVTREPGHGWWQFSTTAPEARLSASADRRDAENCRRREIIRYACVLAGWSHLLARAYADSVHPLRPLSVLFRESKAWRKAQEEGNADVA